MKEKMKNIRKCVKEIHNIQYEYAQQETTRIIEEEYDVIKNEIYNAILLAAQNKENEIVYIFEKEYYVPYELRHKLKNYFECQGFNVKQTHSIFDSYYSQYADDHLCHIDEITGEYRLISHIKNCRCTYDSSGFWCKAIYSMLAFEITW